jgi:hypothetical protein
MSNRQKNAERRANRKNMRESRKLKSELAEKCKLEENRLRKNM